MPGQRYLNLVFQGGGVRGIAYAGVLDAMPVHCSIHSVGGTSAGAIVAALLAIGKRKEEINEILRDRQLYELLDRESVLRQTRLKLLWADVEILWSEVASGKPHKLIVWLKLFSLYNKHKAALSRDLGSVWQNKGIHQPSGIRNWLNQVLQGKCFRQTDAHDLKIVVANVNDRKFNIYNKKDYPNKSIAEAVHESISIPVFFEPFTAGNAYLVDGGVLSNFPSFLFVNETYPTVGFRLKDVTPPEQIDSTWSYLKSLVLTMAEAHDKERGDPPYCRSFDILVPDDIPAIKFSLTEQDVQRLYLAGCEVGQKVNWDECSKERPLFTFYDPKPNEALRFCVENARSLWDAYDSKKFWVEILHENVIAKNFIEKDWSTRYEYQQELVVKGSKQLLMERAILTGLERSQSIIDIDHHCRELNGLDDQKIVILPAFNEDTTKGFVIFFVPPITEDARPRTVYTSFSIPEEFSESVAKDKDDTLVFSIRKRAEDHKLRLNFEVWVDVELPEIELRPDFSFKTSEVSIVKKDDRMYNVHVFEAEEAEIVNRMQCEVMVKLVS